MWVNVTEHLFGVTRDQYLEQFREVPAKHRVEFLLSLNKWEEMLE